MVSDNLTIHETVAAAALHEYVEVPDSRWWVLNRDLYRLYRAKFSAEATGGARPLGPRSFGAMLKHLYPHSTMVRRNYLGILWVGREGIKGPLSRRSVKVGGR